MEKFEGIHKIQDEHFKGKPKEKVTCYKYGGKGHITSVCPKGVKCFNCKEFGKISTN